MYRISAQSATNSEHRITEADLAAALVGACAMKLRTLRHPDERRDALLAWERARSEWLLALDAGPALSGHAATVA